MLDVRGAAVRASKAGVALSATEPADLSALMPASLLAAVGRGFLGRCPKCACARLFRSFLQPVTFCPACGQDWRKRTADDFPPYLVILAVGHIIAPGMIAMERGWHPELWVHLAVWLPVVLILSVLLILPMKGAVIGGQWWHWDRAERRRLREASARRLTKTGRKPLNMQRSAIRGAPGKPPQKPRSYQSLSSSLLRTDAGVVLPGYKRRRARP